MHVVERATEEDTERSIWFADAPKIRGFVVGESHEFGPGARRILVIDAPHHEPHRPARCEVEVIPLALVTMQCHVEARKQKLRRSPIVAQRMRRAAEFAAVDQYIHDVELPVFPCIGLPAALDEHCDAERSGFHG